MKPAHEKYIPFVPLKMARRADEWGLRLCHLPYRHL